MDINIKNKQSIKKNIYEIFQIVIGAIVMACGTSLFLLPNKLSSGGFSGLATIGFYLFNWKMGYIIILLNIPCFILAFLKLGKIFVFRSIFGTIMLSFFIDRFNNLAPLTTDRFLGCIYGGIVIGIGTALILRVTGSTGGSDLVSYIIKSFKPGVSTSNVIVIFDFIVIRIKCYYF